MEHADTDCRVNVGALRSRMVAELSAADAACPVDKDEAVAMTRELLRHLLGFTPTDIVLKSDYVPEVETAQLAMKMVERIRNGEPMQYVTGHAWFHGMDFVVTPDVLIPRPETSQLVDMIVDQMAEYSDLRVLDIGTGSGCIATALALSLPFSQVIGIDISVDALAIARINAKRAHANVDFVYGDALDLPAEDHSVFDIIVSNPPYILERERSEMDRRVHGHEPSTALFVPDDEPLRFYEPIAEYASHALVEGGLLYFEINPLCVSEMCDMLRAKGFSSVDALRDYKGNYRFVSCCR